MAYLSPFWVRFDGHSPACVEDVSKEAAKAQAEKLTGKAVTSIETLPYPAKPRISEKQSECPDFCYSPEQCKGRTSCPKRYACSE
jgi:hypothetical protein